MDSQNKNCNNVQKCPHTHDNEIFKEFEYVEGKPAKQLDQQTLKKIIGPSQIFQAHKKIENYVRKTPLEYMDKMSERYDCKVFFKREDYQVTSSYKVRGIFNKLLNLTKEEQQKGLVCTTTGNQGAAIGYACQRLNLKLTLVVPKTISNIKYGHIKRYVSKETQVLKEGDDMNQAEVFSKEYAIKNDLIYINYDDDEVIYGCGTVGKEILDQIPEKKIDYIIYMISSGLLSSGMGSYFKHISPDTIQIGVQGQPKDLQHQEIKVKTQSELVTNGSTDNMFEESEQNDQFRCKHAGVLQHLLDGLYNVDHGLACSFVTYLFDKEKIVMDPQSACPPSGIELLKDKLKGKTVVCVLSGCFRHDVSVLSEIKILSQMYEKKLFYLLVNFFTKHGGLKIFIMDCLTEQDQITQIEYTRKNNREKGPALVGIQCPSQENFDKICQNLKERKIEYQKINQDHDIFKLKV